MKKQTIKCLVASLVVVCSVSYIPLKALGNTSAALSNSTVQTLHKDKNDCGCDEKKSDKKTDKKDKCNEKKEDKKDDKKDNCKTEEMKKPEDNTSKDKCNKNYDKNIVFNKETEKYLTKDQCKQWKEIKACNDKGDKLTKEQEDFLYIVMDCVVKGKLGDKNYKEYKDLAQKSQNKQTLTDEENKKLKEFRDMISSSKPTVHEFLHDFLR